MSQGAPSFTEGSDFVFPDSAPGRPAALFFGSDGLHGREPWSTDGATMRLLKDIAPGVSSSLPAEPTAMGPDIYFTADDGVHGLDVWMSDGTAQGTRRVKDVVPNTDWSLPGDLSEVDGTLCFSALDGDRHRALYVFDPDGSDLVRILGDPGAIAPFHAPFLFTAFS